MRILGIDFGLKRIGLALSDELGLTAQPLYVLKRTALVKDVGQLLNIIREKRVKKIVIGWPMHLNGSDGTITDKVTEFIQELRKNTDIEIIKADERWTSLEAERLLITADMSRNKRRQVRDKLAASLILQTYLDRIRGHEKA